MNIQKISLGALKKAKASELKYQKKLLEEARLSECVKSAARSVLPDIKFLPNVNKHSSDSFTISEYIQSINGNMYCENSVWAPWVKRKTIF
jgi:hypothetical protein